MAHLLERSSRLALGLIFPARCAVCSAYGALICERCTRALPLAEGRRCQRCWTPSPQRAHCACCATEPELAFTSIRAPFVMEDRARTLVHQLKYGGMAALGEPMGALIAQRLNAAADVVVPVPLHRGRQRARGYNQAELLARHIASAMGAPLDARAARRIRATKPLARSMHRDERRAIVAGAFAAVPERVDGRRILLVDDVVTTGATLDACARALLDAGAAGVRCITFARAD